MEKKRIWHRALSRRDFFKTSGQTGITLLLTSCSNTILNSSLLETKNNDTDHSTYLKTFGPIDRSPQNAPQKSYSGDNNTRAHRILWDTSTYLADRKVEKIESAPLVIVGGGASGLFSAYQFKDQNPIILEQANRFGGNAKGESWNGLDYAIGSAYIDTPHKGSPMEKYYQELELEKILVKRQEIDPAEWKGQIYQDFWSGEAEPEHKLAYQKLEQFLQQLIEEKERAFPFIPSLTEEQLNSVKYYDQFTIHELISSIVGGKIPPALEVAIEHYCWSSYAGSSKELSAAAVLNFLAQEIQPIQVGSGGNAKIVEQLLKKLLNFIPPNNLRCNCIVMKVKVEGEKVHVFYENERGELCKIQAKTVILACPKFVVKKILEDISPSRLKAIEKIKYRSYMVANLYLKKKPTQHFYDLFMLGKAEIDFNNIKESQAKMNATDFVMASFSHNVEGFNVLTFYRAFPYDGARTELYEPSSYQKYKEIFEKQINQQILPLLNLTSSDKVDLRLTLWGHALPMAQKGTFRDDTISELRKPHKERVFFVEQDNWLCPALPTGATDVALMKESIQKILLKT